MDNSKNLNWCSPIINNDVIILSAGASSRMNRPKALLPFDDEENFVEHLIALYRFMGFRVILVLSSELHEEFLQSRPANLPDCTVINDRRDLGRTYSVRVGMAHARHDAHVMIQDVDRPFVTPELIDALRHARTTFGYTAPMYNGEAGHPMLLSPFLATALRDNGSPTLREALVPFHRREVPWMDLLCGANINDPDEYAAHFPEQMERVA